MKRIQQNIVEKKKYKNGNSNHNKHTPRPSAASADLVAYWPLRDGPRTIFGNYASQAAGAPLTRLAHAVHMGSLRIEETVVAPPRSLAPHTALGSTGSQPLYWLGGDVNVDDEKALAFGSAYGGYGALTTAHKVSWFWV